MTRQSAPDDDDFPAALLRPPRPPPVPPKDPMVHALKDFQTLPPRPSGLLRSASGRTTEAYVTFHLLTPQALGGADGVLCEQSLFIHLPRNQSFRRTVYHLLATAESLFGLDLSEESKWRFKLTASCAALDGTPPSVVGKESLDCLMSATREGGWSWRLRVMEMEKAVGRRWQSVENGFWVPSWRALDGEWFKGGGRSGMVEVRDV